MQRSDICKRTTFNNLHTTFYERNKFDSKTIDNVLFSEEIDQLSSLSRRFAKDKNRALLVGAKLSVEKVLLSFASHIIAFEITIARSYGFNE